MTDWDRDRDVEAEGQRAFRSDRMTAAQLRDYRKAEGQFADGITRLPRQQNELPIHKAILQLLDLVMPPDAMWHHSPNELDMAGDEAARSIAKAKMMGMIPGWPDIEIVWRSHAFFMEIKAPGQGPSPVQLDVHAKLAIAGCKVAVVRSVTEAELTLIQWGMT